METPENGSRRVAQCLSSVSILSVFESEAVTQGIRVQVRSFFVPERSAPDEGEWFFAYEVAISNEGEETAQLVSRHWIITDGHGEVQEVQGAGVVGEQPVLAPGASFAYTSACPLTTPVGSMYGTYRMVTDEGVAFDAVIAPFSLGEAHSFH
ncbi:MAG: Co2+/Mg2+ efflux protein ApaG [Deltaproteobacteria bacterium]|nr:Co2+/Mg2+ efflux protein ApaG [Deltaproteobacteria bacterium]